MPDKAIVANASSSFPPSPNIGNWIPNEVLRTIFTSLSLAVLLVASVLLIKLRAAQEEDGTTAAASDVTPAAAASSVEQQPETTTKTPAAVAPAATQVDPQFAVPEGTVAQKLAFLDKLTQPATPFASAQQANKYWSQAAVALSTGADQVLSTKPTDEEASQAVQFKAEGLRILAMLGDKDADRQRTEFLDASLKDPRFAVSSVIGPLRMIPKMRRWQNLDVAERKAAVDNFIADVSAAGPTAGQAQMLVGFADSLSDSPNPLDTDLAARAVDNLLPKFQAGLRGANDPREQDLLATLEGLSRRLHLVGSKLGLEGTLLDGKPLDWEAYRGKVVLVDFWASWCPECIKEVPNILHAYREYHDKGFDVIGICLDNDRRLAEQVIEQSGMTWPQIFTNAPSDNGWAHPLQKKYAVMAIPRAILVDQKGNVVTTMARGRLLDAQLEKLLGPANDSQTSSKSSAATSQAKESTTR